MTKESFEGIAMTTLEAAEDLSPRLIVCGQPGRGRLRTALVGNVSDTRASHARRPISIAPEMPAAELKDFQ
jgi:nucleotide-binding universal stress UspA family protein